MGPLIYFQLFVLGLSFGFAGPCFLSCTPFLAAYLAGKEAKWKHGLADAMVFLSARLLAYIILGCLAGLSSGLIRSSGSFIHVPLFRILGGAVIILSGIFVLFSGKPFYCKRRFLENKAFNFGSLFFLGFIIGISPCVPLAGLLFEIALISQNALQGAFCALSFGLGTFISGFIVIAVLSGIIAWFPANVLKSNLSLFLFRVICALLLIFLGLNFILPDIQRIL
jgi:sulfite exporter TauE/SafE